MSWSAVKIDDFVRFRRPVLRCQSLANFNEWVIWQDELQIGKQLWSSASFIQGVWLSICISCIGSHWWVLLVGSWYTLIMFGWIGLGWIGWICKFSTISVSGHQDAWWYQQQQVVIQHFQLLDEVSGWFCWMDLELCIQGQNMKKLMPWRQSTSSKMGNWSSCKMSGARSTWD